MPGFSEQSETCFQSGTSGWILFLSLHPFPFRSSVFFSNPPSPSLFFFLSCYLLLGRRLDEDRRAFINHPLKRNPWRSIINDLVTNHEMVPRPYETRCAPSRGYILWMNGWWGGKGDQSFLRILFDRGIFIDKDWERCYRNDIFFPVCVCVLSVIICDWVR